MTEAESKLAILDLYNRYNHSIDHGEIDGWCNTFVDDGVFDHPARRWEGREALCEFVTSRTNSFDKTPLREMRHWNDAINICINGDKAQASCDLLVSGVDRTTGKAAIAAVGRYEDVLVHSIDGWRFFTRKLVIA